MADYNRYIRQMILPGFGADAQQKLAEAKVLIVGMGGWDVLYYSIWRVPVLEPLELWTPIRSA